MVFILAVLAITLAVSYATLRGQGVTSQVARNGSRALDAREAAQSGLAAALRKMSENGWSGVNTSFSANITDNTWYQVTFTPGDDKLTAADPQYGELPFRVMITASGYAADPLNPAIRSEHRCRCVVQLLRKRLVAAPSSWAAVRNYTVYQYSNQNVYVQFPVRINGSTLLNGNLRLATEYPNHSGSYNQYLLDLNLRRLAGKGDDRPFPTTIVIALSRQDSNVMNDLTVRLGMVLVDSSASTSPPLSHPGTVLKYRLYPGGQEYSVPSIHAAFATPLQNVTIAPDPATNPLGIYRCGSNLTISNNVSFTGTLIADSSNPEIQISGTNVTWQPARLPALYGTNQAYEMPGALAFNLRMNSGSKVQMRGATLVWNQFEIRAGSTASTFSLAGNLVTDTLLLRGRTTWTQTPTIWSLDLLNFNNQKLLPGGIPFFPDYQETKKGFVVKPALTFSPDSSGVEPHWHDWSQPVYQPDPADGGLRWEVVRWEDNL